MKVLPCLCMAGGHQREHSFGNSNKESHKYAYKYDMGQVMFNHNLWLEVLPSQKVQTNGKQQAPELEEFKACE